MYNMHDVSAPQQGGADFDGDIFFLCDEPLVAASKIDKHIILDIEDKVTARARPYTAENLVEYEVMTRDSRIGEITNAATSIENKYTTDPDIRKRYDDYASLLRIFQGKEIDFLKTGFRWHMNNGLRKHLDRLPYFLLFHYPAKRKAYQSVLEKNKRAQSEADKAPLNAYRSPSPMKILCDYICAWEKKQILWNHDIGNLSEIRELVVDTALPLSDKNIGRICRKYINQYAAGLKQHIALRGEKFDASDEKCYREEMTAYYRKKLLEELQNAPAAPSGSPDAIRAGKAQADDTRMDERLAANYVISVSYASVSISKSFAWSAFGDYIIENLRKHTNAEETFSIQEVSSRTEGAYEYLGKYYQFNTPKGSDTYRHK